MFTATASVDVAAQRPVPFLVKILRPWVLGRSLKGAAAFLPPLLTMLHSFCVVLCVLAFTAQTAAQLYADWLWGFGGQTVSYVALWR